jgi:hypothetical protein
LPAYSDTNDSVRGSDMTYSGMNYRLISVERARVGYESLTNPRAKLIVLADTSTFREFPKRGNDSNGNNYHWREAVLLYRLFFRPF